jgi:polyisoprenoid-binding protein YceI
MMPATVPRVVAVLTAAAFLAGCSATPPAAPASDVPTDTRPSPAVLAEAARYTVDPARSWLRIRVYRAGPMASMGHSHIVSTDALDGELYRHPELARSWGRFGFAVTSLVVDDPELRSAAGPEFDTELTAEDIAATRGNMLGEAVLDAEAHPRVTIEVLGLDGTPPAVSATLAVTLRGRTREEVVPVELVEAGGRLRIAGSAKIVQSRYGIEPFSAMLGALRVRDALDVSFDVTAVR